MDNKWGRGGFSALCCQHSIVVLCLLDSEENIFSPQDFLKATVFIKHHMPIRVFKSTLPKSSFSGFPIIPPPPQFQSMVVSCCLCYGECRSKLIIPRHGAGDSSFSYDFFMLYHLASDSSSHFPTCPYLEIRPNENPREPLLPSVWGDCIFLILSLHAHPPGGPLRLSADSHQAAARGAH